MSGVTTRLTVGYVRERGGEQAVAALLARAGERRTVAELEDERGWSSYAQWLALLEAAVAVLGDRDTARRIGASVVSQRVGGASRVVVRALGSVEAAHRHAGGAAARFSTMKTVEPLEVGRSYAGVLTQVPALFGLAPATVDHATCRARGGPACEFRLTWSPRRRLGRGDRRRRRSCPAGAAGHPARRGSQPAVHADGFPPAEAARTAAALGAAVALEDANPGRRHHDHGLGHRAASAGRDRPARPLDPNLPERLYGLADHGATALQRTRLTDQVLHDALTGLPNQALFTDRRPSTCPAAPWTTPRRWRRSPVSSTPAGPLRGR